MCNGGPGEGGTPSSRSWYVTSCDVSGCTGTGSYVAGPWPGMLDMAGSSDMAKRERNGEVSV